MQPWHRTFSVTAIDFHLISKSDEEWVVFAPCQASKEQIIMRASMTLHGVKFYELAYPLIEEL
jgi:hypothetical protein